MSTYRIKSGDTLSVIARLGDVVSMKTPGGHHVVMSIHQYRG